MRITLLYRALLTNSTHMTEMTTRPDRPWTKNMAHLGRYSGSHTRPRENDDQSVFLA